MAQVTLQLTAKCFQFSVKMCSRPALAGGLKIFFTGGRARSRRPCLYWTREINISFQAHISNICRFDQHSVSSLRKTRSTVSIERHFSKITQSFRNSFCSYFVKNLIILSAHLRYILCQPFDVFIVLEISFINYLKSFERYT